MGNLDGNGENIANRSTAAGREPTDFPDDSPLGKGDLLGGRQVVERGDRFQLGLRIDPRTQSPPVLLHLPR